MPAIADARPRLLVIGLDGAEPSLVFGRLAERMPFLNGLAARGFGGPLRSTDPPVSLPAWASMFTGRDPGELGLYGFRLRTDRGYGPAALADSRRIRAEWVWDGLSRAGLTSTVIGVPGTFPPWPLRGRLVAGVLSPGPEAAFVWPPEQKAALDALAGPGGYRIDVDGYRTADKQRLRREVTAVTRARFRVARAWAAEPDWDLMVLVDMGPDRMHHGFWRDFDPAHRLHRPNGPHAEAIPDFYAAVDREVARLVAAAGDGVAVLVVSDHGGRAMQGALHVNEWLIQQGDLRLLRPPAEPGPLRPEQVDWEHTRAWADGGFHARIWINRRGREPRGAVAAADYDAYRSGLAERLAAIGDESGRPLGTRVLWPERRYRQLRGVAPDLIAYPGDLAWRAAASVGSGCIHARGNDTGPDDANHSVEGICLWFDPGRAKRDHRRVRSILEIAPLILEHFGLETREKDWP